MEEEAAFALGCKIAVIIITNGKIRKEGLLSDKYHIDLSKGEFEAVTDLINAINEIREKTSSTDKNSKVKWSDDTVVTIPVDLQNAKDVTRLRETFNLISSDWLVTYVGDLQMEKMKVFLANLRDKGNRRISSGHSYWGIGPALRWQAACTDPLYHMKRNIDNFPKTITSFKKHIEGKNFDYVSIGVGEGAKDVSVLSTWLLDSAHQEDFTYFPVDISIDMLRFAIDSVQATSKVLPHQRVAIQRDFEDPQGLKDIVKIAHLVGNGKPILYGFIGNTISNLDNPTGILTKILEIMEPEDLLLFEAQIVDRKIHSKEEIEKLSKWNIRVLNFVILLKALSSKILTY